MVDISQDKALNAMFPLSFRTFAECFSTLTSVFCALNSNSSFLDKNLLLCSTQGKMVAVD